MPTPTTGTWQMADRLAGGELAQTILDAREAGHSWPEIARGLLRGYGIVAHVSTLADWHRQLSSGDGTEQVPPSPPASPDDLPSRAAR